MRSARYANASAGAARRRFLLLALAATVIAMAVAGRSTPPAAAQPQPRPFVIASMGDSYAAGQGVPNVNAQNCGVLSNLAGLASTIIATFSDPAANNLNEQFCGTAPQWTNRQCHRSNASPHRLASNSFQAAHPELAVEFFSVACSGATIRDASPLGGLLTPYRGEEPTGTLLGPQVDQLDQHFGARQIDALIITIGGNDIGFAPTFASCMVPLVDCNSSSGPIAAFLGALGGLDAGFDALADAINQKLKVANVYLVGYPRLWRNPENAVCDNNPIALDPMIAHLTREENTFIQQGHELLQQRLAQAAQRHASKGWIFVDGIPGAFDRHGYCASDAGRFINTTFDAIAFQGQLSGMLHPNRAGYDAIAGRILPKLSTQLVAPATPTGLGVQNILAPLGSISPSVSNLTWSDNSGNDEVTFQIASRATNETAFEFGVVRRNVNSFQIASLRPTLATTCIPTVGNPCPQPTTTITDYFVRACKTVACSPWSTGLRVSKVSNQLPQPQGTSPAGTAPSNALAAPAIPGATIGVLELNPSALVVAAGEATELQLSWTVPEPMVWRDLDSVELLITGNVTALRLRFDEATGTLSVFDETMGGFRDGVAPGSEAILETPYAAVNVAGTVVEGSGPTGRSVTLRVALSFKADAPAGAYLISVTARADDGRAEEDVSGAVFLGSVPAAPAEEPEE